MSAPDTEALALSALIRPLLAGKPSEIQSAALADLVALWLAGHYVPGNVPATNRLRADVLMLFIEAVATLAPVNAHLIGTDA